MSKVRLKVDAVKRLKGIGLDTCISGSPQIDYSRMDPSSMPLHGPSLSLHHASTYQIEGR